MESLYRVESFDVDAYEKKWGVKCLGDIKGTFTISHTDPNNFSRRMMLEPRLLGSWSIFVKSVGTSFEISCSGNRRILHSNILPSFILQSGISPATISDILNYPTYATCFPGTIKFERLVFKHSETPFSYDSCKATYYYDKRGDLIFYVDHGRVHLWSTEAKNQKSIDLVVFNTLIKDQGWIPNYADIFNVSDSHEDIIFASDLPIPETLNLPKDTVIKGPLLSDDDRDPVSRPETPDSEPSSEDTDQPQTSVLLSGALKIVSGIFNITDEISKLKAISSLEGERHQKTMENQISDLTERLSKAEKEIERLSHIESELETLKNMIAGKFVIEGNMKFVSE